MSKWNPDDYYPELTFQVVSTSEIDFYLEGELKAELDGEPSGRISIRELDGMQPFVMLHLGNIGDGVTEYDLKKIMKAMKILKNKFQSIGSKHKTELQSLLSEI